jgi:hypothetical protein
MLSATLAAHAMPSALLPNPQDIRRAPEASFEQRIDPWSRWSVKLYADPVATIGDVVSRGGMEARYTTQRLDAHQLDLGAAAAFSPAGPAPVEAWQAVDDRSSSVFVEDRWHWSPSLSMTAGARLVDMPGGAAIHHRVSLAWQPADDWTLKLTNGSLQPQVLVGGTAGVQRFRGVELQTERDLSVAHMVARVASHQVSDTTQSQALHAAALLVSVPLGPQWSLGSETMVASQGDVTRLKLSGTMLRERAKVSLVVPRQFQTRTLETDLGRSLPSVLPDDTPGWRARFELRF